MAYTPARFYHAQPATAEAAIGAAVPNGTSRIIKSIIVTNTGTTASTLNLSMVPSAASAGVQNRIISNLVVQPGQTLVFDMSLVMTQGDFFSGYQSLALGCTVSINGVTF